jgi:hypothetical protein
VKLPLALVTAFVLASSASAAVTKDMEATAGDVHVRVAWVEQGDFRETRDVRLTIRRGATTVLDGDVLDAEGRPTFEVPWALRIRDLDGDGQLEVLLDLFSGGAHCCFSTLVHQWDAVTATYAAVRHAWGNPYPRLRDVDRNGMFEFISADDRFAYAFACYACGALPIQVWHYELGRFVDVTREFPDVVRKDAAALWKSYRAARGSTFPEVRGILAAWLADQALLGRASAGWRKLEQLERRGVLAGDAPWPSGKRYLTELRRFLAQTGYL